MQTRFIQSGFYYHFRKKAILYLLGYASNNNRKKSYSWQWNSLYSLSQSPLQQLSSVHDNCDCTHLQSPLQPFSCLQEHLIKSRIAIVASGRSVQCGIKLLFSIFHPQFSGFASIWSLNMYCAHTCPAT